MVLSQIPASQFEARCLALLDEVRDSRRAIVITKCGKPIARLVPFDAPDVFDELRGSILEEGDLISPLGASPESVSAVGPAGSNQSPNDYFTRTPARTPRPSSNH